ncbi:paired amphipathic helix [Pilobolus umbonatus]|nr:paired amphipathic helix [Pilobolus umbonatus]
MQDLFGKTNPILSTIFSTKEQEISKIEPKHMEIKDAVGYLEQIKSEYEKQPEIYNKFLKIMHDFRLEKINTPQVLEQVTLLFRGKPWLIRNFLMFLPPEHILNISPEDNSNSIYIATPTGGKIIINTDEGIVTHE